MNHIDLGSLLLYPLALVCLPQSAFAWGQTGHRIVGEIAQHHLTPMAGERANQILKGRSLAQVSTWPDEIRSDSTWDCAKPFHFVTVPPGESYPSGGVEKGDAVQAVVYYTDVLTDPEGDSTRREIALSFIVHLVGDLHQPLHNGLGCDHGGNAVEARWFDEDTNLHAIWDEKLIESEGLSYTEFAQFLEAESAPPGPLSSSPLDWIRASQERLPAVYQCHRRGDGCSCFCGSCSDGLSTFGGCGTFDCKDTGSVGAPRFGYSYRARHLPVVREQLRAGGLHLAELLNWALVPDPKPPEAYRRMSERIRALKDWDKAPSTCRGTNP